MAFITRGELRQYGALYENVTKASRYQKLSKSTAQASVFLSHSHHDKDLVASAATFLASQGVTIYIDWLDDGMPDQTNGETATRIKAAIAANAKFVMLATDRSLSSRWVPWELGVADGIRGAADMAVLAVREDGYNFRGSEYLTLYPTIQEATTGWGVFPPDSTDGHSLEYWLKK